ncbi:MAG TPA: class I SAM-dependent methyltransferase [Solirubrobacterales bacterium]|jgi:SAM-dependent methyltransferase|nr:class I SAM-dependent methyltransferase [Solirubrobacterales bacterium]
MTSVAPTNEEAVEAWNGVLFDRFLKYREILTAGLGAHGEEALRIHPPALGERAIDIGCGFGDTSQRIAELVGPEGSVLGFDAAPRFVELARGEAEQAGLDNVEFAVGDLQVTEFEQRFDYAFSRMGTMFFANPVPAMRNLRKALAPGGRLCMVVWRRKIENEWVRRSEQVVERFVEEPEESDEPTCGPGPFSMGDADVTSQILLGAGFEEVTLRRCDSRIRIGRDLDQAIEFAMALGPAGEVIRLAGAEAERLRPEIEAALRQDLAEFERPDGVWAGASTWIVSARAPRV